LVGKRIPVGHGSLVLGIKTKRMFKKQSILIGVIIALLCLVVSTFFYPGGSQHDEMSVGFSWRHNYLSNLLNPVAVNGWDNPGRPWAIGGVLFLCGSAALVFVRLAAKIQHKSSANVVRYAGVGAVLSALLAATPLHDLAVRISGTLLMLALFYATVFLFRTKLHWLKALSVLYLLVLYGSAFIYYTSTGLAYLPVVQKLNLLLAIAWLLAVEYFTKEADFGLEPNTAV
jgi:Ca2+/Na+ antiporter